MTMVKKIIHQQPMLPSGTGVKTEERKHRNPLLVRKIQTVKPTDTILRLTQLLDADPNKNKNTNNKRQCCKTKRVGVHTTHPSTSQKVAVSLYKPMLSKVENIHRAAEIDIFGTLRLGLNNKMTNQSVTSTTTNTTTTSTTSTCSTPQELRAANRTILQPINITHSQSKATYYDTTRLRKKSRNTKTLQQPSALEEADIFGRKCKKSRKDITKESHRLVAKPSSSTISCSNLNHKIEQPTASENDTTLSNTDTVSTIHNTNLPDETVRARIKLRQPIATFEDGYNRSSNSNICPKISLQLPKRNIGRRFVRPTERQNDVVPTDLTVKTTTSLLLKNLSNNDDNDDAIVLPEPKSTTSTSSKSDKTGQPLEQFSTECTKSGLAQATTTTATQSSFSNGTMNAAWKPIPRPGENCSDTNLRQDSIYSSNNTNNNKRKRSSGNENLVRLNMRNKAGSCLGGRNVKVKSKASRRWEERKKEREALWQNKKEINQTNRLFGTSTLEGPVAAGPDPVDDYVDGVFSSKKPVTCKKGQTIPLCSQHRQPCKLLTVKKTGPNKGRKFYACSCTREEQCNFFQWSDDTILAAQEALYKNTSQSGFIARQVQTYMTQIRSLTMPELRVLAQQHNINPTGKKAQLLMRLSIWVRDEVANCGLVDQESDDCDNDKHLTPEEEFNDIDKNDNSTNIDQLDKSYKLPSSQNDQLGQYNDSDSSSDEELELTGEGVLPFQKSFPKCVEPRLDSQKDDSILERESQEQHRPSGNKASADLGDNAVDNDIAAPRLSKQSLMQTTLQKLFGHSEFRDGQEWAISRCLNLQRSLLVAPTGFGKSLCFTLPAAMMDGVCVVVSPLLSLIQDQIRVLPPRLPAVTLSGSMTTASTAATLDDIVRGRIKILFVSPERLTSSSFRRLFRQKWYEDTKSYKRMFPPVSLLCVDEAHCLSQWAHNFRPSYLRLRSMIDMIEPQSVLAITATAGPRVVTDICRTLRITNTQNDKSENTIGVRISKTNRDNIDVSCILLDTQEQRLDKLLRILSKSASTKNEKETRTTDYVDGKLATGSVIVYVWRQRDAEVVAENIQAGGIAGGVVIYHGGMDSTARAKAQSRFMRGKVRICVATIAFGLGINKADVVGVVHLYLSSSPEHYLQEIGRAGRNGQPANAIALVLKEEVLIRHSLAHSDLISVSQIKALLSYLQRQVEIAVESLPPERSIFQAVNVSLPLAISVLGCDCKPETAETIVSLLEQPRNDQEPLLMVEGTSYDKATIVPKRLTLKKLAEREPVAKAILFCARCVEVPAGASLKDDDLANNFESNISLERDVVSATYGSFTFSVAQVSNCLGDWAEPRHVFAAIRRLQNNGDIDYVLNTDAKDRALNIRLTNAGMDVFKSGNQHEVENLAMNTLETFISSITSCANKVLEINHIMKRVSGIDPNAIIKEKSARLALFQDLICSYLEAEGNGEVSAMESKDLPNFDNNFAIQCLSVDVQTVLSHLYELRQGEGNVATRLVEIGEQSMNDYTSLTVAKFLHGIAPASLPIQLLRQHHLFGKMQRAQFCVLHKAVIHLFEVPKRIGKT